ncbi:type II secretion system GspH family protein [Candidatus Parcubacteria bacterium]|nr:type II secretion system GspH family protein [Candidatus Parcubacteria bacterium]
MKNNIHSCGARGLEQGFTLIEVLVGIGIISIIAFFLAYISAYHFQTYNTETVELDITSDARAALDEVDNYVRQSNRILSSYSTYTTGTTVLVLQVPSIDSSSQLIESSYDTVVFYLSGTDFSRRIFPSLNSTRPSAIKNLAQNIDTPNFSFAYDNADYSLAKQVTTTIAVLRKAGSQTKSITVSSQSKLRNY